MTLTVNLPKNIEQAYAAAAHSKGVSIDALAADVLVSHAPTVETSQLPEVIEELGIPVLRTGQPLDPRVVADTLESIRRERDLSPANRAAAFQAWAESHPRTTPVLSDEAISRETIYQNRG